MKSHPFILNSARRVLTKSALATGLLSLSGLTLAQSSSTPAVASGNTIKIGVLPNISSRALLQLYQPMRSFFEQARGVSVEIQTAPDFVQFYRRTIGGMYDYVFTGSHMGRLANIDHGHGLAGVLTPDMKCLLVNHVSRPLTNVQDLRGKSICFANSASIVAIAANRWLLTQGLKLGSDVSISPVLGEDSISNKLMREEVLAAFMSMGEYRAVPEEARKQLNIFTTYQEIPAFVISKPADLRVRSNTAALADFEQLKKECAEFNKSNQQKQFQQLSGFSSIQPIKPEDLTRMDSYVEDTRRLMMA